MNLRENKYTIEELEDIIANYNLTHNDWVHISADQILTEEFIRMYKDNLNWVYLSWYQKLSESFIEEYVNKVDWNNIVGSQKLSYKFLKKYLYKFSLYQPFRTRNAVDFIRLKYKYPHKYQIDKLGYTINNIYT